MKIDWKSLAKSKGYKSLKAAYIYDLNRKCCSRSKSKYLEHFNWAIGRAKHYAYHKNISIEAVLNEWEEQRDYWWLNFYQNGNQPKFHSNSLKPIGEKGLKKRRKLRGY